ncbi:MAG TPA: hypothetical protein VGV67_07290 [Solirubrobacteraceae bacterium]|nr:hypothetical protein [Solirubrobacteraceae bacterium]
MKTIWRLSIATALCMALGAALAGPTLAQSSAAQGYDETGIPNLPPLGAPPPSRTSPPDGFPPSQAGPPRTDERLPFTGLELPMIALLGGTLVAAGLLMRGRYRTSAP